MSKKPALSQDLRNVFAQGMIGFMVSIGAYMLLVDPASKKLAAAKAQEISIASQASAAESLRNIVPQISAAATRARDEADRIVQTGRLARQEQELFAALSALAARTGIRVDQLTPNKLTNTAKAAPPGQPTPAPGAVDVAENAATSAIGYTIDATASYSDLATFLKATRTELGYCSVKSVRISPTSDIHKKLVHAIIMTEHYSFDASPAVLTSADTAAGGAH